MLALKSPKYHFDLGNLLEYYFDLEISLNVILALTFLDNHSNLEILNIILALKSPSTLFWSWKILEYHSSLEKSLNIILVMKIPWISFLVLKIPWISFWSWKVLEYHSGLEHSLNIILVLKFPEYLYCSSLEIFFNIILRPDNIIISKQNILCIITALKNPWK